MNIKKELKLLLRELEIKQEDLYYLTGYHFNDCKSKEDLEEIKRLLNQTYYIRELSITTLNYR